MSDCKGIKILLAKCPSSDRDEDFLHQPEVSWNLRPRCVSILLSLFLMSWFPALWVSCHFPWVGFSSHSAPNAGASAELGLCCAWLLPCGGRAEIVWAKLNPSHGTVYAEGECVIALVYLAAAKIWSDRQASITALCYNSILFRKQRKIHPWGVRTGWPKKTWREENSPGHIWLLFLYVLFSSPVTALHKLS